MRKKRPTLRILELQQQLSDFYNENVDSQFQKLTAEEVDLSIILSNGMSAGY